MIPLISVLLTIVLSPLCLGEKPEVFICEAHCASKFWVKASSPPKNKDYAITKIIWIEYFFRDQKITVIRPISHPLGRADSPEFAYCFKSSEERYASKNLNIGKLTPTGPYLSGRIIPAPDMAVSDARLKEFPAIIKEYSTRLKPVEFTYLQRLTSYKMKMQNKSQ